MRPCARTCVWKKDPVYDMIHDVYDWGASDEGRGSKPKGGTGTGGKEEEKEEKRVE